MGIKYVQGMIPDLICPYCKKPLPLDKQKRYYAIYGKSARKMKSYCNRVCWVNHDHEQARPTRLAKYLELKKEFGGNTDGN